MTPSKLWDAYSTLNESKTKNNPVRTLTDLISIIRFSTGSQDMLVSFTELVDEKFEKWISNQKSSGIAYTTEQMEWLVMIKEQIAERGSDIDGIGKILSRTLGSMLLRDMKFGNMHHEEKKKEKMIKKIQILEKDVGVNQSPGEFV